MTGLIPIKRGLSSQVDSKQDDAKSGGSEPIDDAAKEKESGLLASIRDTPGRIENGPFAITDRFGSALKFAANPELSSMVGSNLALTEPFSNIGAGISSSAGALPTMPPGQAPALPPGVPTPGGVLTGTSGGPVTVEVRGTPTPTPIQGTPSPASGETSGSPAAGPSGASTVGLAIRAGGIAAGLAALVTAVFGALEIRRERTLPDGHPEKTGIFDVLKRMLKNASFAFVGGFSGVLVAAGTLGTASIPGFVVAAVVSIAVVWGLRKLWNAVFPPPNGPLQQALAQLESARKMDEARKVELSNSHDELIRAHQAFVAAEERFRDAQRNASDDKYLTARQKIDAARTELEAVHVECCRARAHHIELMLKNFPGAAKQFLDDSVETPSGEKATRFSSALPTDKIFQRFLREAREIYYIPAGERGSETGVLESSVTT